MVYLLKRVDFSMAMLNNQMVNHLSQTCPATRCALKKTDRIHSVLTAQKHILHVRIPLHTTTRTTRISSWCVAQKCSGSTMFVLFLFQFSQLSRLGSCPESDATCNVPCVMLPSGKLT